MLTPSCMNFDIPCLIMLNVAKGLVKYQNEQFMTLPEIKLYIPKLQDRTETCN